MAGLDLMLAETSNDIAAVQQLCRDFVAWQHKHFPHLSPIIDTYFEPSTFNKLLDDLPRIHARPKGSMFLARRDSEPVGCIMHQEMEPGVAEMKRLFVSETAQGHGVGRALVEALLRQARDDGYHTMRLDTAKFLTGAIALYKRLGFTERDPFFELPSEVREKAVFMERKL